MTTPAILLVDDDPGLTDMLSMALGDAGFRVHTAGDGAAGWTAYQDLAPRLVILDVMMPELDGFELCRRIRAAGSTPVIMLTSRSTEVDTVVGLELGADDYMAKPFSTRELIARVRAALRRTCATPAKPPAVVREHGTLVVDRHRRQVTVAGGNVELSATEFELLWTFVGEPGRAFDRATLVSSLYTGINVSERNIDTFVKRLRKKLGSDGEPFDRIETVRGVGYRYRD